MEVEFNPRALYAAGWFMVAACRMVLTRSGRVPAQMGVSGASMRSGKNPRMDVARVDADTTPCLAQCESVSDPRHRGCDL